MIKHFFLLLSLTMGLLLLSYPDTGNANILDDYKDEWKEVFSKNEIDVYQRSVSGMPFDEFMAVGIVNARLETLIELIRAADCVNWAGDCIGSEIVKNITPFEKIVHFEAKVLWPVTNRDTVFKSDFKSDYENGKVELALVSLPKDESFTYVPQTKEFVRMDYFKVCFFVECLDKETQKIYLTVRVDPAGNVPSSIANVFGRWNPYKTLMGVRKEAKDPKYIQLGQQSSEKPMIDAYLNTIEQKEKQ